MQGDIVFVDYELSAWKYQNDDYVPSKYLNYILGNQPLESDSPIVNKSGYILREDASLKGIGSAYGGEWKPSKPADERFIGKPGEKKITYTKKSAKYETKIGQDGKAVKERHNTDHNRKHTGHTNPHDHEIDWNNGFPHLGPPINYPNGAPEFKGFKEMKDMSVIVGMNTPEDNRFKTISDFKWCMKSGGEVEFVWDNNTYNIVHDPDGIVIYEAHKGETECKYQTADEVLEYLVKGIRLRDIITEVEVTERTI